MLNKTIPVITVTTLMLIGGALAADDPSTAPSGETTQLQEQIHQQARDQASGAPTEATQDRLRLREVDRVRDGSVGGNGTQTPQQYRHENQNRHQYGGAGAGMSAGGGGQGRGGR
ncbi:MAG: hypothetical protein ACFCUG_07465 [Thiotrichales bacterium]